MRFDELKLIPPLLRAVREAGYETPSPIQEKAIPPLLSGRDILGCAQTGTGKTAAFALPILQRLNGTMPAGRRPIRALILTPTRELAIQIYENFAQYGRHLPLRCAVIFGGVNQNPQVETLKKGVDILVATPGRLNDLIGQGFISLNDLSVFVLDEADRMLDMGFIHDVKKVIALLPDKRQTMLFSATMPAEVEKLALQLLRQPVTVKITPVTKTVDAIGQSVYYLEKGDKVDLLLDLLEKRQIPAVLVFTRTKHGANQLAAKLVKAGVEAMAIHGNKSQNARQEALGRFKAGTLRVLVATDIAARGIDVAELPYVINYNVPDTPEAYIHRIGRTGRAGASGLAVTFCCSDELEDFRDIEKHIGMKVPVGTCPWSVTDMQPTKAPPPGSNRPPREKTGTEKAPIQTKKAESVKKTEPPKKAEPPKKEPPPQKGQSQKGQPPQKGQQPQKEQRPQKGQQAPKGQQPQKGQPEKEQQAPQKQPPQKEAAPKRPAPPTDVPATRPERGGTYAGTYASRYGAARPIRPFQSRASLAPKAEDFPPPEPVSAARTLNWNADEVLPERRLIVELTEEPKETAPAASASPAGQTPDAPKKRRHRGGRRHHKPASSQSDPK